MSENKTHYRKVFKSDHLGCADLEDFIESGSDMVFTIKHVKQEFGVRVAGKKGDHNIAYFVENIKPLVVNAGNSLMLKGFANGSSFIEDWVNLKVRLYIDPNVRFGNDVVSGVRIHPEQPQACKSLQPNTKAWENSIIAYKRDGNLDAVKKRIDVSPEIEQQLIGEVNAIS